MTPRTFEDSLEATVDFNEQDDAGLIVTALAHLTSPRRPHVGQRVWLRDSDGNRCWGTVVRVRRNVMHLRLDRSTWLHGDLPERAQPVTAARGWSEHSNPSSSPKTKHASVA